MSFSSSATTVICGAALLAALAGRVVAQDQGAAPSGPVVEVPNPAAPAESLAKANQELETLRAEYERLRLQTEALGLAGLKPELRPLQERLLAAVSDYRLADRRVKELTERVVSLSEASLALLSDPQDKLSRERLQQELAAANQSLISAKAETAAAPTPLESAKVISLKNDLGLAVINTGAESGLRLGTPMRLVRGEKIVATGLVVDVRSRIAGLLMTSTSSAGALKVGDLAKPETISTLK
ncbi:MAG: hypothetical protein V4675_03055 [Verrucomicrobiota bacterium]